MMAMSKNSGAWGAIVGMFVILTFVISCSPGQSTPLSSNSTLPTSPSEPPTTTLPVTHTSSPIPTGSLTTPVIRSYQDLKALINADPAKIDNANFPITPLEALHPTTQAPQIDMTKYQLTVDGLVDTPLTLTYADILKYPSISAVLLLICPGVFADNAEWTGVPVKTLLEQAGIKPEAYSVAFHALDSYLFQFNLEDVLKDGVFLAYQVNGQTLPLEHGYPLRLVVKGRLGSEWVKWLNQIEVR
jgi:DMSO/TMAO reductase YedYZ molybdopterin-dependent catalytic subunit